MGGSTERAYVRQQAEAVMVPEFVPKVGVKIQSDPKEEEKAASQQPEAPQDDDVVCEDIIKALPLPSPLAGYRLTPCSFEKDDDDNFHVDFITASSNLRAANYKIAEAEFGHAREGGKWTCGGPRHR